MKYAAFWLILVGLLYGFMEITALVSYRVLFGESFSFSHMAAARENNLAHLAIETQQSGKTPTYLLHPYYGYILNPNWYYDYQRDQRGKEGSYYLVDDPINAFGFFSSEPAVQPSDPGKIVVAVVGGSVAAFAALWGRDARRQLLSPLNDHYFCRRRVSKGAPLSTAAALGNGGGPVAGRV